MTIGSIGSANFKIEEEKKRIIELLNKIPILENKDKSVNVLESLTRALIKKYKYQINVIYFSSNSYTCSIEQEEKKKTVIYALTIEELFIKIVCYMYWHSKKKRYF